MVAVIDRNRGVFENFISTNEWKNLKIPSSAKKDYGSYTISLGDFNAHSHPEQSIYVELVDPTWDLATWCKNTIYKYSCRMTPKLVYLASARAFSRMASYGVTSVMVSFYCHNQRGNDLDREVIRAARDVGLRLYFGRMHYDIVLENAYPEKHQSQHSYYETIEQATKNYHALQKEVEKLEDPRIVIAPALHSFHANTLEAIIHGINLGFEKDRVVQLHLSEDEGDVLLSQNLYGKRPVEVLDQLYHNGKIQSLRHVMLSDCIWTNDNEKDLIARHGMKVVLNSRMNNRVNAGQADLKAFLARGIFVYVGTDGEASNDDLSIRNEVAYLKKININISVEESQKLGSLPFDFHTYKIGVMEPGAAADFKVLDGEKLVDLYVGGKKIIEEGVVKNLDVQEDIEVPLELERTRVFGL
ncbi:amidohydrolase family protein [Aminobacterium sp. MB27-C1]|uniref:amidohydrolase family protein n=1 Tax=unclassified Aminobacterium TaxID=2685012 RepID=UPI0027DE6354|nr:MULTISPECIES: amidohydrolase family protein [unclassified Aminobacterium]MEA4877716.1 amidohydrolase family protein [Aminobacterium sp.]WMI70836.1 amidohydrolase family protein [Aminobacterium sp. MB27-C1]